MSTNEKLDMTAMRSVELTPRLVETLVGIQRQLMSDWSEDRWCAGWLIGLEECVWSGSAYGHEMAVYDPDVAAIHDLSSLTGVWCTADGDVPLDTWAETHGPPLTQMADEIPTAPQQEALQRVQAMMEDHWRYLGKRFGIGREKTPDDDGAG